jgi:hypothetical protein
MGAVSIALRISGLGVQVIVSAIIRGISTFLSESDHRARFVVTGFLRRTKQDAFCPTPSTVLDQ